MTQEDFLKGLRETYDECLAISTKKNSDYADRDDAFKNFNATACVDVSPERGILVRVMDKITRVSNLLDREAMVEDEKIDDTLLDLINYLAILRIKLKEKVKIKE